ncbi:MAG: hypothetical protein AAFR41_09515 [Pseudomonadota bacterium]
MQRPFAIRGASGKLHGFSAVHGESDWLKTPGVVLFAAPDGYGWRIIRVAQITGRPDDVQPLWAHRDAERYGADTVMVLTENDQSRQRDIIADLEVGMSAVLSGTVTSKARAA